MIATETPKTHPRLDNIAARIRAVREGLRLTVVDAAKKARISRTSMTNWENGKVQMPDEEHLGYFAKATQVSLDWLASGKGPKPMILANFGKQDDDVVFDDERYEPIPEVSGSMALHSTGLDLTARTHWVIPNDVLLLAFNAEPGDLVIQRVVTSDGAVNKGEYVLIDVSRKIINEPGIYLIAGRNGLPAQRVSITDTDHTGDAALGRIMGVFRPT
jgi:transcriptional regulator with XRE-family HTH domain